VLGYRAEEIVLVSTVSLCVNSDGEILPVFNFAEFTRARERLCVEDIILVKLMSFAETPGRGPSSRFDLRGAL
ncbi:hypothetical protein A2U01_0103320, partial [Trifolium medium]|nr:hypothetical protein [Trifolium medium]